MAYKDFKDKYDLQDEKAERGFVYCDDLECQAKKEPDEHDIRELSLALEHWRNHGYLHGCSHGS